MTPFYRIPTLCLVAIALFVSPSRAQEADTTAADYAAERHLIQSTLGTLVKVIKTATFRDEDDAVGDRLQNLAQQLSTISASIPSAEPLTPETGAATLTPASSTIQPLALDDLQTLESALNDLYAQVRELRATLEADESYALAEQMAVIEDGLDRAVVQTRRIVRRQTQATLATNEAIDAPVEDVEPADEPVVETEPMREGWLRPGVYEEGERTATIDDDEDDLNVHLAMDDVRREVEEARSTAAHVARDGSRTTYRYRNDPFDRYDEAEAFVGEFYNRWPYRETGLYRPIPPIRYNRVEGLVLGARFLPLEWGDFEQAKVFGQAGYAFELQDIRYEVGAEFAPFYRGNEDFAFKLGGSYRQNTSTNDLWKISWVENTLAAMFFEYDYMDYYEVEGYSLYAMQRLTPFAQLSAGYRAEDYSSLSNNTSWSLFGSRDFRLNPLIDAGRMESYVFALEGGMLAHLSTYPRGMAYRVEVETGKFDGQTFNRYLADARFYIPTGYQSTLALRLRGGMASDDAPFQKLFSLGGVGSVRGYPQNGYIGSRMLLANGEFTIARISPLNDIFDDVQVFGFGDAAWTNTVAGTDTVDLNNLFTSAGFGMSFADRTIRLELAWPLTDLPGVEREPMLWLRLTPTF